MRKYNFLEERLRGLDRLGLKRTLPDKSPGSIVNFSSNDYLGLSHHPQTLEGAITAATESGVGGGSSRLLAGTHPVHLELEKELASFLSKESGLVFASGYHVNTGLLPALCGKGDLILVDRLAHASLLDGVRLSSARFFTFDHNNPDHLESLLRQKREAYKSVWIVTEGIFSMDGDFAMVPEINYLAKKWNAFVYLDEAHSFGLIGPEGRGWAAKCGLLKDIDVFVGTLSKTVGSQGGFVCCDRVIKDLIVSTCRSFIFTTALSPLCAGAALAALRLIPRMDPERDLIQREAARIRHVLHERGLSTGLSQSHIIPIMTGGVRETKKCSDYLLTSGYFVPSIRPPTVPEGQGRVRLSITKEVCGDAASRLLESLKIGETIVQTQ